MKRKAVEQLDVMALRNMTLEKWEPMISRLKHVITQMDKAGKMAESVGDMRAVGQIHEDQEGLMMAHHILSRLMVMMQMYEGEGEKLGTFEPQRFIN